MDSETVSWDFGDGNHSNEAVTTHTYQTSGTYTVRLKARREDTTRYLSKQVTILSAPVAETPADMYACASADGNAVFRLTEQNPAILGSQPADAFTITYHATQQNAEDGTNALPEAYTNSASPQTIYARINRINGTCYDTTSFTLNVAPSPVLEMEESYSFCEGSYTVITAPEGFDSYTWSFDGKIINGTYYRNVNKPGTYTLTVTKATGNIICDATKTFTVYESEKPVIRNIEVNEWTDSNNSITVTMATEGSYEYSIDDIIYQNEPVFENLKPGIYTVTVRDKNGCGQTEDEALILMYHKYYTPNGDGANDKWQVKHAFFAPDVSVTIFDRYGKIITSFKGNSSGWDGNLNGYNLPASDYWFIISRKDGKEFKGHFSLLR
jgi:gliding motility-associated-like protein